MAQFLSDKWANLKSSDVWVDWPWGGKIKGVTMEGGAVDNSPLLAFLKNITAGFTAVERAFVISSTNVDTGEYHQFTDKNITLDELADAAVASASIPMVFPPHVWEGKGVFMDGMTAYNTNAESAIERCLDGIVDDESKIIVDVLICGTVSPTTEEKSGNGWENYFRGRAEKKFYNDGNQLIYTMRAHPNVNFRYVVHEQNGAGGTSELNFNASFTNDL